MSFLSGWFSEREFQDTGDGDKKVKREIKRGGERERERKKATAQFAEIELGRRGHVMVKVNVF